MPDSEDLPKNVCKMSDYSCHDRVIDIKKSVDDNSVNPEAFRLDEHRFAFSCRHENLKEPEIDDDSIAGLVISDSSDEEVHEVASNEFDALNYHLLSAANHAKEASKEQAESLSERFKRVGQSLGDGSVFKSLFGREDIVTRPKSELYLLRCFVFIIPLFMLLDLTSVASFIQGSGDFEFVSEGGYLKALGLSAIVILGMFILKFLLTRPRTETQQELYHKIFLYIGAGCAVILFIAFSLYYSGGNPTDSWDETDEVVVNYRDYYKVVMIIFQLFVAAFSGAYAWYYAESDALKNKKVHIHENPMTNALEVKYESLYNLTKESLYVLATHKDFYKVYESAKAAYKYKFFGRFSKLKLQHLSVVYHAKSELINVNEFKGELTKFKGGSHA
jgi:hypothetical protein